MTTRLLASVAVGLLACWPAAAAAQDAGSMEVTVLEVRPDSIVVLEVDGKRMFAITGTMMRNALKVKEDLEAAERKLASTESLLASYDTVIPRYEAALGAQREYIVELEQVADGYKELAADYKQLRGGPWLSVEGGLGATGDSDPAILVGLAIRQLRVWGFLQESNSGGFVGVSLPVF